MAGRLRRVSFVCGLAAAAGATAGAVLGVAALLGYGNPGVRPALAAAACGPVPQGPRTVVVRFLRTAVVRRDEICSYELVTGNVRLGFSRSEWAQGDIPVVPFPTERPETLRIETRAKPAAPDERAALVVLDAADAQPEVFELVLVRSAGAWRVDYWAPAYVPGVPLGGGTG